ncbi:MAG TPA: Hsp33 family molecular chaperone HslO [Usitatibacteraceae bacterium]|nr:Hsp33 family molecular chaperone HslO [Usitatibacteraceae bacterium]
MTSPTDFTQRFILENLDIRGQIVRLGPVWRAILSRRDYPVPLRQLLGEFASIAVLIASGLKHPGRTVLQVMGQGPITMAVADCTHEFALRSMLKPGEVAVGEALTLHEYFPSGRLVLTVENATTARHFQSIVPLEGDSLADCFERYFDRSEQVPTHLWVQATEESVGALILQKLPKADERDPSGWARVQLQAARMAPLCLGSGAGSEGIAELLTSLFPEDDIRLYKPKPVKDGCTRSEEKVVAMLRGLGRTEVEATLAEHGVVTVRDEICNQEYRFAAPDVERIFEG